MNRTNRTGLIPALCISVIFSCGSGTAPQEEQGRRTLADARKGFTTKIIREGGYKGPVDAPPDSLFSIVNYPTAIGPMAAYLGVVPDDGRLHPAMIWITGGFGNGIGDVWTPQETDNDQSAAVIREAGIIMMHPSQRGAHNNPGSDESCFGEVDDILAAADYLSKQKGIDPDRIYLGGHSTGGTKVLLAAECSNRFRAVFSLGPVDDVSVYGPENLTFNPASSREVMLRAPGWWLHSLRSPVFVFEGRSGNIKPLRTMSDIARKEKNTFARFHEIRGRNHFSLIRPLSRIIARKVLADTIPGPVRMRFESDLQDF